MIFEAREGEQDFEAKPAKTISSVVLVDVQIDVEGKVIEAVVLMGGEHLRDTARTSALQWRLRPMQPSRMFSEVTLFFMSTHMDHRRSNHTPRPPTRLKSFYS
jgi:hypothetical protein